MTYEEQKRGNNLYDMLAGGNYLYDMLVNKLNRMMVTHDIAELDKMAQQTPEIIKRLQAVRYADLTEKKSVDKLKPCRCGRMPKVVHLLDAYDDADFGYIVGCPSYSIFTVGHTESICGISREYCIEVWNRRVESE